MRPLVTNGKNILARIDHFTKIKWPVVDIPAPKKKRKNDYITEIKMQEDVAHLIELTSKHLHLGYLGKLEKEQQHEKCEQELSALVLGLHSSQKSQIITISNFFKKKYHQTNIIQFYKEMQKEIRAET